MDYQHNQLPPRSKYHNSGLLLGLIVGFGLLVTTVIMIVIGTIAAVTSRMTGRSGPQFVTSDSEARQIYYSPPTWNRTTINPATSPFPQPFMHTSFPAAIGGTPVAGSESMQVRPHFVYSPTPEAQQPRFHYTAPDVVFRSELRSCQVPNSPLCLVAVDTAPEDRLLSAFYSPDLSVVYPLRAIPDGVTFYVERQFMPWYVPSSSVGFYFAALNQNVNSITTLMTRHNGVYYRRGWILQSDASTISQLKIIRIYNTSHTDGEVSGTELTPITIPARLLWPLNVSSPIDPPGLHASSQPNNFMDYSTPLKPIILDIHAKEKW